MTEQEWLASNNYEPMFEFVKDRLTDRQRDLITKAFQNVSSCADWYERRSQILREIIGNPFRCVELPDGCGRCNECISGASGKCCHGPNWLTWNNSTILHIVAGILEERCSCGGPYEGFYYCKPCNSTGFTPRTTPRWSDMPILADALEEAGCTEKAILEHLRGEETCHWCHGNGWFRPRAFSFVPDGSNPMIVNGQVVASCEKCNGTGKRPVTHVRGCWVLELLGGHK